MRKILYVTTLYVLTYICSMEIGQEIKQGKFKSEYQKLGINIAFTSSWMERQIAQQLKPHKLTAQQFNILRILRGQQPNPATINLLTERMLDKNSNASRLVDKLVKKEFASRQECPADRRQVDVAITKKGLDLLAKLDKEEEEWAGKLKVLSAPEAKELNRLLDKLRG
ncbi:MAG: MarR family winged helix-turn-helix transcriptional regulator [Candidatus Kapaibacterium sp.]